MRLDEWFVTTVFLLLWGAPVWSQTEQQVDGALVVPDLQCLATQTGGFHDYPGDVEQYEAALFHPGKFSLQQNSFLTENLASTTPGVDLYLTLTNPDQTETELECRSVRGTADATGFSCVNTPPSQMLLLNAQTHRFTRTAVGGWTFTGAADNESGDSIYVEYGQCEPLDRVGR